MVHTYVLLDTVPDLVVKDYDTSAQIGDFVILRCDVTIPFGSTITYQWRRADMSPISAHSSTVELLYLPYVGVSDAGVYICGATVNDPTNNPYVIPQNGSISITLTVTSK